MAHSTERAVLAGGCFWGMQDLIRKMPGVLATRVGYSGGDVPNATYHHHGTHAEAIEILFDPKLTSYRTLLEFFFQIDDPTTAQLEAELTALGNYVGIGAMGFAGTSLVVATHVEIAFTHTGGMPVGIHAFCLSSRRATARIHADGRVEFRSDPQWFTDYYRREGIE